VSPFDLSGRAALVTGGGRGIGAAIVTRLAEAGAQLVIANRSRDVAGQLAADLTGRDLYASAIPFEKLDRASLRQLVDDVARQFGRVSKGQQQSDLCRFHHFSVNSVVLRCARRLARASKGGEPGRCSPTALPAARSGASGEGGAVRPSRPAQARRHLRTTEQRLVFRAGHDGENSIGERIGSRLSRERPVSCAIWLTPAGSCSDSESIDNERRIARLECLAQIGGNGLISVEIACRIKFSGFDRHCAGP
jgi:hypothetical protein